MEFSRHGGGLQDCACDAIVFGVYEDGEMSPAAKAVDALAGHGFSSLHSQSFSGGLGETLVLPLQGVPARLGIAVGLGPRREFGSHEARHAAARAARAALSHRCGAVAIAPESGAAEAMLIGAGIGGYRFEAYRTDPKPAISRVMLAAEDGATADEAVRRASAICAGISIARDLINTPPNDKVPGRLAQRTEEMAQASGLRCEILDARRLEEMGAGGILAVGRGSAHPPAMVILRHDGGEGPWHGFLGKGITFDSGGLDLKTQAGMLWMKDDMSGAATVAGAMQAIAQLGLPGRYVGVLAVAENMPGASAFRPSDVLRMLSGKTVEVSNTDAEGRLVLADGIELLRREGAVDIVDLATLTGAIVVALGSHRAGLFSNSDDLAAAVLRGGDIAGERYWRMPLDREHRKALASEIADTQSTGGREGGASTAAEFLHGFAGDLPWVHLDIAGTAFSERKGPLGHGATGFGVETLVRMALG